MTKAIKYMGARTAEAAVLAATFASAVRADDCTDPNADPVASGVKCAQPSGKAGSSTLFGGDHPIFQTVANTLIFIVLAVSVIMLIIGGLRYVLSSGEASAVKGAKDTILYAIIGIVVAILAFAIVSFVASRIGASGTV